MTSWNEHDLATIGGADEVDISANRADGSPGTPRTIWVVRVGDELFVRSWRGTAGGWYRRALASRRGTLHAGGVAFAVAFVDADPAMRGAIDAAYREKYARYGPAYVRPMTGDDAATTTLRLDPAGSTTPA